MAINSIRIHNQTHNPESGNVTQVRAQIRNPADLSLAMAGWKAIYDGIDNFGQGVRSVGQSIKSIGAKSSQATRSYSNYISNIEARNAIEEQRAKSEGRAPLLETPTKNRSDFFVF